MFTFSSTVCSVTLLVVLANSPVSTANPETKPMELPYTTPNGAVHVLECPAQVSDKASQQDGRDWLTKEGTCWGCVQSTGKLAWIKVAINRRHIVSSEMYQLYLNNGPGKLQKLATAPNQILHILYCVGNICTVYTSKPRSRRASVLAERFFKEDADTYCSHRDVFEDVCAMFSLSFVAGLAEDSQTILKKAFISNAQGLCVDTISPMNGRVYAQHWTWCSDVYGSTLIGNMKYSYDVCEEGMKGEVEGIEKCTCVNGSFQCQVYNDKQLRRQMCLQNGKQIDSVACGSCKCDINNHWQCSSCPVDGSCGRYSHLHVSEDKCLCSECYPNTHEWITKQRCVWGRPSIYVKKGKKCIRYMCNKPVQRFVRESTYAC